MKKSIIVTIAVLAAVIGPIGCDDDSVGPVTDEGGWDVISLPTENIAISNLQAVSFYDENTGWIVGYGGNIFKTIDGGATWERVFHRSGLWLYDVCPVDSLNFWAAGMSGLYPYEAVLVYSTEQCDSIMAYLQKHFDVNAQLTSVEFCDLQSGFAIGGSWSDDQSSQVLLRTTDRGQTWSLLQCSQDSCRLHDLDFGSSTSGCIVGANAAVFKYDSEQMVFNRCENPSNCQVTRPGDSAQYTIQLYSVDMVDESLGWCVGSFDAIFQTEDGGTSWVLQNIDSTVNSSLRSVSFLDGYNGVAVGDAGKVLVTEDGGNTWTDRSYQGGSHLTHVAYISAGRIIAVGEDMLALVSR
ncbi:MAG: YCF48-related protein [Candidatus Zixiibacteriota bacterium]